MRKGLTLLCVAAVLMSVGQAVAQEEDSEAAPVTQAELASMMAKVLGLQRFIPPSPSPADFFFVLAQNGITPLDGWKADEVVTVNTLAVTVVQALKWTSEVEDPNDAASYVSLLQTQGVPLDTVGAALAQLKPLDLPVAPVVVAANVDPSTKRMIFNPVDELTFGADAAVRANLVVEPITVVLPEVVAAPAPRPRRTTSPI
jgi:hypothetical protein